MNQSLKNRIRYGMTVNSTEGVNWVEELPVYEHLYNTSPHQALGTRIHLRKPYWCNVLFVGNIGNSVSPFEVFYGRISNAVLRGHLGHTSEISDEMVSSSSTISGPQDPEPVSQGDGESDVPFSSSDETDQDTVRSHCVAEWLETCRLLREAALKSTNKDC